MRTRNRATGVNAATGCRCRKHDPDGNLVFAGHPTPHARFWDGDLIEVVYRHQDLRDGCLLPDEHVDPKAFGPQLTAVVLPPGARWSDL